MSENVNYDVAVRTSMPFFLPLLAGASVLGGHAVRMGITSASVRGAASQFAQSLPFGAGYSLGTYLGFPKNFQPKESRNYNNQSNSLELMPYGYYPRRRSYSRYPSRSRSYRRRSYRSRYY